MVERNASLEGIVGDGMRGSVRSCDNRTLASSCLCETYWGSRVAGPRDGLGSQVSDMAAKSGRPSRGRRS